jgi:hypothetical protein
VLNLRLLLPRAAAGEFSPLLQGGVDLTVPAGTTVQGLLSEVIGLSAEYIGGRVSTVFLDGKPVDDLPSAVLTHGSVLALSAAMPGLVGGAMRCGSPLASMRSSISHRPGGGDVGEEPVVVRVKVFNLLLGDLGVPLLEGGVLVSSTRLQSFLARADSSFWSSCREVVMDGRPLRPGKSAVEGLGEREEPVLFTVRFEE